MSSGMVDGFTALKAAQKAAQEKDVLPPSDGTVVSGSKEEKRDPSAPRPIASHASRTVMPTKYEVICYECEHTFQQTGRMGMFTVCPKCRARLEFQDHRINKEWSEPLKTAGTIHIQPEGVVRAGDLFAADLILEGRIEGGRVDVYRKLVLHGSGRFNPDCLTARDLEIPRDQAVTCDGEIHYHDVTVIGRLQADLLASGHVIVRRRGLLEGVVHASSIEVQEGGALNARLEIRPRFAREFRPEKKSKQTVDE